MSSETTPDSINKLVFVGEFGFQRLDGPFSVSKDGTLWHVHVPTSHDSHIDARERGTGAVLIADCEIVGGGVLESIEEIEGDRYVNIDQYAIEDL